MNNEENKNAEAARREDERRKNEKDDRYYEIIEGQKNRNQNRRDAVLVSVSIFGAGFCGTAAEKVACHPFYGWIFIFFALIFVVTIFFVVVSCNQAEKAINKKQKELSAEHEPKSVYNGWAFRLFALALFGLFFAFVGYFAMLSGDGYYAELACKVSGNGGAETTTQLEGGKPK